MKKIELKLSHIFSRIALNFKDISTYYNLKYYIKNRIPINLKNRYSKDEDFGRSGIVKAMLKLSLKYDIPIVISDKKFQILFHYIAKEQHIMKMPNIITIDEVLQYADTYKSKSSSKFKTLDYDSYKRDYKLFLLDNTTSRTCMKNKCKNHPEIKFIGYAKNNSYSSEVDETDYE